MFKITAENVTGTLKSFEMIALVKIVCVCMRYLPSKAFSNSIYYVVKTGTKLFQPSEFLEKRQYAKLIINL